MKKLLTLLIALLTVILLTNSVFAAETPKESDVSLDSVGEILGVTLTQSEKEPDTYIGESADGAKITVTVKNETETVVTSIKIEYKVADYEGIDEPNLTSVMALCVPDYDSLPFDFFEGKQSVNNWNISFTVNDEGGAEITALFKTESASGNAFKEVIMPIIAILCGLALFLFGMKMMSEGLEASAGSSFKKILDWVTKNRFIGVLTGTLVTAVIQSSSATTVMVVGFVNAGLLQLSQAVGVIMGANIGTTVTGIIVSLKIGEIAPIAVIVGIFCIISAKRDAIKFRGQVIAGLGILFLGMTMMGDTLKPLAQNDSALAVFEAVNNPFLGILLGLAFTALIQSSSATIGILIVLGNSGLIDLNMGIFMVYGACIGTCVTAIIASVGASKPAKRVSVVHFCFNVIGTLIFTVITLLPLGYVGFLERVIGDNIGQQIAISTVIFKVTTVVIMFPFANVLVKIANIVIPVKEDEKASHKRLLHIDNRLLSVPHVAIEQTHKEIERMGRLALDNYRLAVDMFLNRNTKNTDKIKKNEEIINFLNHEITKFLIKVTALEIDKDESKAIGSFYHIINDIERIGDHAENIMEFSIPFIEEKKMFSEAAVDELRELTSHVEKIVEETIDFFAAEVYDKDRIKSIENEEEGVDDEVELYKNNHILRLNEGVCTPNSGMLFVNMLSDLERISDHASNIATSLYVKKVNS